MSIKLRDICKIVDNVAIIVRHTTRSLSATYLLGKKSITVERERERQRQRETDRERQRETERKRERQRQRNRETERQREREIQRDAERQRGERQSYHFLTFSLDLKVKTRSQMN